MICGEGLSFQFIPRLNGADVQNIYQQGLYISNAHASDRRQSPTAPRLAHLVSCRNSGLTVTASFEDSKVYQKTAEEAQP
jgi:hypothetical protein